MAGFILTWFLNYFKLAVFSSKKRGLAPESLLERNPFIAGLVFLAREVGES